MLPAYNWARRERDAGLCIVSGFHSRLERDVLDFLLAGSQPIIMVVARGLPRRYPRAIQHAIAQNRLLVISPFPRALTRATAATAHYRNQWICTIADQIVVGYVHPQGRLMRLLQAFPAESIDYLD